MLKIIQRYQPEATQDCPPRIPEVLSLPFELRCKGRFRASTDSGQEVGVFIERGQVLQDGDLLQTECGQLVQVRSQAETVVTASTDSWLQFAKACYHLGNRHVPLQVGERWLRFQPDHVLEELVRLHGLSTLTEAAEFSPENGAYGHLGGHSHGDHEHSQGHSHEPPNSHSHEDRHAHTHAHS
ncbi:urease accessory protein UreE [Aestuariirhabdus sp. Z084]|uniref:urease accessory protein UreE n=1 Tax=Aestuariirhabdus haliotis TaxID=2918751 RepID=UPI00201B4043|nr:urease accessory protein UreE [Aestuariirhabdus haliotis]MCL6415500.1 urease accessory protein UreE [Aestuariirhabdus haliotis]MCL6419295.1 urease accessory protein UreE [Aestuariirhabdus haliotis]